MAQRAEYGFAIGSGEHFELGKYYAMCDEIVARLRMHPELLEAHLRFCVPMIAARRSRVCTCLRMI